MKKVIDGYKLVFYYLSIFIMMIGGIILLPCLMFIFYPFEINYFYCFITPGAIALLIGYVMYYFLKDTKKTNLENHQDAILVVLVWIIAIILSSIPFIMTGKYNFTQAIFEATSGYSTTGLSVVDVSNAPHVFLFYRSIMLFVGGVGFVLILTSAISDKYSFRLYQREGHMDKLLPNLVSSARLIFSIYFIYILLGTILYVICGMPLFDAVNHSIAAVSTGGFSTKPLSIGEYNNLGIEIITIILMLLGSTNFLVHLGLIKRNVKTLKHVEKKMFLIMVVIFVPLMTFILCRNSNLSFLENLRVSIFSFVSCISTTGFQNVDSFNSLPCGFLTIMILLMLVGGELGSTAGGMKQYRVCVALKGLWYHLSDGMSSHKVIKTHFINRCGNNYELNKKEINQNLCYVLMYLILFFIGSFIITCFGYSLSDAMFEFSSSISTVGLSVGITGYNAHPVILWVCSIGMFFGRLEIIVIFEAIIRLYRDIRRKEVI